MTETREDVLLVALTYSNCLHMINGNKAIARTLCGLTDYGATEATKEEITQKSMCITCSYLLEKERNQ